MRKIYFQITLFIAVAAVFGFLGYAFPKLPQPTIVAKDAEISAAELPGDFPREFLVDKDAKLVAAETMGNGATAIFISKLSPAELLNKLVSSVESSGWKTVLKNKDDNSSQLLARREKENSSGRTMEFRSVKFPDGNTEANFKYTK